MKNKVISIILIVGFVLLGVQSYFSQVSGNPSCFVQRQTGQTLPAGLWRQCIGRVGNDEWSLERAMDTAGAFGSTVNVILVTGTSVANTIVTFPLNGITVGVAGATSGIVRFAGSTSGTVTVTPAAAAGTWTWTWPINGGTNGQFLSTDGSGGTTWSTQSVTGTGSSGLTVWNSTSVLGSAASVAAASGGTAINTSGSTGLPYLASAGVWSVSTSQSIQVGNLAIGAALPNAFTIASLYGTVTGGANSPTALDISSTVNAGSTTNNAIAVNMTPTVASFTSGTNPIIAAQRINATYTDNGATVTNFVGLDIASTATNAHVTTATSLRVAAPTTAGSNLAINIVSGDIYKAGTAYTNPKWALKFNYLGYADKEGPYAIPAGVSYRGLMPLEANEAFTRKHFDLPLMLQNLSGGAFDRGDLMLASLEEAYLYIYQLNHRIKALEVQLGKTRLDNPANRQRKDSPVSIRR